MPVRIKQSGVAAQNLAIEINFNVGFGSDGDALTINFDDESVIFTAKDNPTGVNEFLSDSSTSANKIGEAHEVITSNWLINKHFQTFLTGNVIYLFSREKKDHNASVEGANIQILWTGGMNHDIAFGCGVEVYNGSDFIPTNYDKLFPVDGTGTSHFNIKDAFDLGFDIPSNATISKAENGAKTYRVAYYRKMNGIAEALQRTGNLLVINGASEHDDFNWFGLPKYLTTFGSKQVTRKETPQWISIANTIAYSNVVMEVSYTKIDGAIHSFQVYLGDLDLGLYHIQVGHDQLNLSSHGDIKSYDVRILYGGNNSDFRTYTIDNREYNNIQTFVFHNSKGGIDTLICTGETEFKTEFTNQEAEREVEGFNIIQKYNAEIGYQYKQYSGYLRSRKEQQYFDELLLSEKVWWLVGDELTEIFITSKANQKASTNDDLFSTDFEFTSIYKEKSTPTP